VDASLKKILDDFKKKIFKNIYFVFGEEEYYHDYIEKRLTAYLTDSAREEWEIRIFYGRDTTAEQLLTELREFGMFTTKKLIVLREAQEMKSLFGKSAASKNKKDPSELFIHYLEQPSENNILYISYKHGSPDKRTQLFKKLQQHAVLFESKKIYDNKIPDWIKEYVSEHRRSIQPKAITLLAEHVGNDLHRLHMELQKLFITIPEKNEITLEDVRDKTGIHKEFNIFELQQALARKNILKATQIAMFMGDNEKEHPMPLIIASLYGYFMKILRVHYLNGKTKSEIASALGIPPFFADEYLSASHHYSPAKIKKIIGILKEYDLKSKGVDNVSSKQKDLVPEMIYKILH